MIPPRIIKNILPPMRVPMIIEESDFDPFESNDERLRSRESLVVGEDEERSVVDFNVGSRVSLHVGNRVGMVVGLVVGNRVGMVVGLVVGNCVGKVVGLDVGRREGGIVGLDVGNIEGEVVGLNVGETLGETVGTLGARKLKGHSILSEVPTPFRS